jgi:hypothetical protein
MTTMLGPGVGVSRVWRLNTWTPALLGSLVLMAWYDGADSSTLFQDSTLTTPAAFGDFVGGWKDKSGNNNHALQPTGSVRPTRAAGNVLQFTGTQRIPCADYTQATQAQPVMIVTVGTNKANLSTEVDIPSPRFLMQRSSGALLTIHAGTSYTPAGAPSLDERRIKLGIYNGASSVVKIDGATIGTTGAAGANGLVGLSIGGQTSNFLNTGTGTTALGRPEGLCEVLVIAGILSAGDESLLMGYLTSKWF